MKEKVIAFDKTKFGAAPGSRKMRMTIMVNPNEHALVLMQHTEQSDATSQAGVLQYILPNEDYDLSGRDRMTYLFDVPAFSANAVAGGSRFILKVLTFRRDIPLASQLLKPLDTPYGLLNFNPVSNAFEPIPDPAKIDRAKKTLLLIHGTISYTDKSYGKLREKVEANGNSWLQNVLKSGNAGGKYDQVIGFNHPTIIESPLDNAAQLGLRLQGKKFSNTVDIITSSRGGLVGKSVVNNKSIHDNVFQVERAAPVACANGVGYFTVAENIARFLSVARAVADEPTAKLILGLAQQGVTFVINQPGLEAKNPNSKVLNQILNIDSPANTAMRYMPVCGDFKPDPNADFKTRVLDGIIGKMLNTENDWVVGTNEQAIMPPAYYAYGKNHDYYYNLAVNARHLSYFDPAVTSVPKQRIYEFMHQPYSAIV